jgi:L-iditol 2-dehydrogenase
MRALLLESVRELRLHDLPKPDIGAHDLLIRVKACGICGSDVHGYDGSTGRRIPPVVMGHEAAGIVEEKGSAVERFQVGDRVTFDSTVSCGRCPFCRRGEVNLCEKREVLGVSCADYRRDGAFAEFVSVPEHIVYNLPPEFSFEHAALIEAVSIVVHAAKLTGIQPGDSAVVVGAGMIGLLAVQAFRAHGCARVLAVDLDQKRLALARQMGAEKTFLATDPDLIPTLRHVTDGGPDIAVEVVGLQKSVTTAIESVRRGGTVTLIGNLAPNVEIPLQTVVTRQLRLLGSCASAGEYGECIALMEQGAIRVDPLISAVAPLNEGPAWFDRLYNRQPDLMKVILQP